MANSQYLSDFSTPSINGMQAQRVLANEVLRQIAQGILENNERGVTQRFSSDTSGAQIRIFQIMPFNLEARELGATLNGANFDTTTALQGTSNGLGVDVITVINQNIDIPNVTQDMIPIDLLGQYTKNLVMDINNNINAMTIGGKMVASFNDVADENQDFIYITKASATGEGWKQALIEMNSKLDEGDSDNGISYFPDKDRCFVLKTSIIPYLFKSGAVIIGGSNFAQSMLAMGGISPEARQDIADGYVGDFMGNPVYKATPLLWKLAAKFAGVPTWSIDDVYGYVSSAYANVRAIAQNEQIKIIDAPDGAGVRLQPNFRMGFKTLYPKGNVFLVETSYTNPADTYGTLSLKGPKSRSISSDTSLRAVSVTVTGGQAASASYDSTDKQWEITLAKSSTSTSAISGTATAGNVAKVTAPANLTGLTDGSDTTVYFDVIAEDGTTAKVKLVVTVANA